METMRAEIAAQPPVEGGYSARRGDYCIAKFADGEWCVRERFKKSFFNICTPGEIYSPVTRVG